MIYYMYDLCIVLCTIQLRVQHVLCRMEEAQCGRCNSRCRTSLSTATLFGIYFQPSFVVAAVTIYMNLLTVHSFFLLFPLMYCVCYLFLSYTDRTMQCEIGIQWAHRRHRDLRRSWGPIHYAGREGAKDNPDRRRWLGSFHRPHAS